MCPADSVATNRIILNEGLFMAAMSGRCAKRLWLMVIGTSSLRFRRRALRQFYDWRRLNGRSRFQVGSLLAAL